MPEFDNLPAWARNALNGERLTIKVRTADVAPYIRMGALRPSNIDQQLADNDKRLVRERGVNYGTS